jgi:hypothetical protein
MTESAVTTTAHVSNLRAEAYGAALLSASPKPAATPIATDCLSSTHRAKGVDPPISIKACSLRSAGDIKAGA